MLFWPSFLQLLVSLNEHIPLDSSLCIHLKSLKLCHFSTTSMFKCRFAYLPVDVSGNCVTSLNRVSFSLFWTASHNVNDTFLLIIDLGLGGGRVLFLMTRWWYNVVAKLVSSCDSVFKACVSWFESLTCKPLVCFTSICPPAAFALLEYSP